jgi:hypothetical protein
MEVEKDANCSIVEETGKCVEKGNSLLRLGRGRKVQSTRYGFVAPVEKMPRELVTAVEPDGVSAQKPAPPLYEIGLRRLDDEVEVIGHEAISMDAPSRFPVRFPPAP